MHGLPQARVRTLEPLTLIRPRPFWAGCQARAWGPKHPKRPRPTLFCAPCLACERLGTLPFGPVSPLFCARAASAMACPCCWGLAALAWRLLTPASGKCRGAHWHPSSLHSGMAWSPPAHGVGRAGRCASSTAPSSHQQRDARLAEAARTKHRGQTSPKGKVPSQKRTNPRPRKAGGTRPFGF